MREQTENNLISGHFWGGTARQKRAVKIETRCISVFQIFCGATDTKLELFFRRFT